MTTYRSRPVEVEAIQWTGENDDEVCDFVNARSVAQLVNSGWRGFWPGRAAQVWTEASKAWNHISPGDYVIAERNGDGVYPCRKEDFENRWEPT